MAMDDDFPFDGVILADMRVAVIALPDGGYRAALRTWDGETTTAVSQSRARAFGTAQRLVLAQLDGDEWRMVKTVVE